MVQAVRRSSQDRRGTGFKARVRADGESRNDTELPGTSGRTDGATRTRDTSGRQRDRCGQAGVHPACRPAPHGPIGPHPTPHTSHPTSHTSHPTPHAHAPHPTPRTPVAHAPLLIPTAHEPEPPPPDPHRKACGSLAGAPARRCTLLTDCDPRQRQPDERRIAGPKVCVRAAASAWRR